MEETGVFGNVGDRGKVTYCDIIDELGRRGMVAGNSYERDVLECIAAFYAEQDLSFIGMQNLTRNYYNRFLRIWDGNGDTLVGFALKDRNIVMGSRYVDNCLSHAVLGVKAAWAREAKVARERAAADRERLKMEDPAAYYDRYVRDTADDPSWRGPNGTWSLD